MRHLSKNKFAKLFFGIIFSFGIFSCDETNNNVGQYNNGVFVINEGAFGSSNGELSFIKDDNSVSNQLYGASNELAVLGDVFQSMTIVNSNAYLVMNNSNKVVVVNINNLKAGNVITGLSQPRYMVTHNGKGYISEWFSFGMNGNIKVIDLATHTIIDSVQVGMQPDNLLVVNDQILVANSGDTTLHLINTTTLAKTNIGQIDYPKNIVKTNDGNIWVLYSGKPAWSGTQTDGGLLVLNSTATTIVKNINIGSTSTNNPSQLATDGDHLFYEYLGDVYKIDKTATVAPSTAFITAPATYLYGMNYYSAADILYIADAGNFSTSGTAKRYNATTGAYIDSYTVGVAPNGFVFN